MIPLCKIFNALKVRTARLRITSAANRAIIPVLISGKLSQAGDWVGRLMRVTHFVGLQTLLDLIIGTYHRQVRERKVLLFLDINRSTALSERLGA